MQTQVIFLDQNQKERRGRVHEHDKEKGLVMVTIETGPARGTTEWIDEETVISTAKFAAVQHDGKGRPII